MPLMSRAPYARSLVMYNLHIGLSGTDSVEASPLFQGIADRRSFRPLRVVTLVSPVFNAIFPPTLGLASFADSVNGHRSDFTECL